MQILRHAPDFKTEWPHVRAGLERLLSKAPDYWIPEDVYHALASGHSWLYVGEDKQGELLGFTILTPLTQYGVIILHIWAAVNYAQPDSVFFALDDIKEIAQGINAKRVTFSTVRKGLGKVVESADFKPAHQYFSYEL